MDSRTPIDDPDDEVLPASPGRRRTAMTIGCLFVIVVLVFLVWFAATHSGTFEHRGWFGS
jgi:hypothetical protein